MFAALREYFARPEAPVERRGRGRRMAQLFVFEFVVVLLGVLAAALLQDWFSERKDVRRAQAAVAALEEETRRFATTAEYRLRAHDCETGRIARLAEIVRTGGTATEAERDSPLMPMPLITDWSEDTKQIVARHVGQPAVDRYGAMRVLAQMISERQRQLEDQWADFLLLMPGARTDANRGDLDLAVARSSGLLAAIDMNAAIVRRYVPDDQVLEQGLAQLAKMEHPCAAVALKPAAAKP